MLGCGFHPLADTLANQLAIQLTLDISVAIPDEPTDAEEHCFNSRVWTLGHYENHWGLSLIVLQKGSDLFMYTV